MYANTGRRTGGRDTERFINMLSWPKAKSKYAATGFNAKLAPFWFPIIDTGCKNAERDRLIPIALKQRNRTGWYSCYCDFNRKEFNSFYDITLWVLNQIGITFNF